MTNCNLLVYELLSVTDMRDLNTQDKGYIAKEQTALCYTATTTKKMRIIYIMLNKINQRFYSNQSPLDNHSSQDRYDHQTNPRTKKYKATAVMINPTK